MLSKSRHYQRLTLLLDNLAATFAWLFMCHAAVLVGRITPDAFFSHAALLILVIPIQALAFRTYSTASVGWVEQAIYLAKALAAVLLTVFAVVFVTKLEYVSRMVVLGYAGLTFTGLLATKLFLYFWYFHQRKEKEENFTKVLVVGSGPRAVQVARAIRGSGDWRSDIVGFADPSPDSAVERINGSAVGLRAGANGENGDPLTPPIFHLDRVPEFLSSNVVDEVVVALPRNMLSDAKDVISICETEGIRIRLVADIYPIEAAKVEMAMVGGVPVVDFQPVSQNPNMLIAKRIFDLTLVILALPVLVPVFLLIALAVKWDTPGPVFFKQERVGLNKRRFRMFKFRSMYKDAEARLKEIEHLNEAQGPIFKIKKDPRITPVGRFIRKTSLDELPQLINVLLGDMSLVGPRPMSVRDVSLFDQSIQRRRFSVRPGCTCVWQVTGRSDVPFEEWLKLDLDYINRWSLGLDVRILLLTIPTMIKGSGV